MSQFRDNSRKGGAEGKKTRRESLPRTYIPEKRFDMVVGKGMTDGEGAETPSMEMMKRYQKLSGVLFTRVVGDSSCSIEVLRAPTLSESSRRRQSRTAEHGSSLVLCQLLHTVPRNQENKEKEVRKEMEATKQR